LHRPDLQQFVFDKNGGVRAFSEQGKSGSASENTKDHEFDLLSEDKWMFTLRWIHIRPRARKNSRHCSNQTAAGALLLQGA
jgi:hypothetical protein